MYPTTKSKGSLTHLDKEFVRKFTLCLPLLDRVHEEELQPATHSLLMFGGHPGGAGWAAANCWIHRLEGLASTSCCSRWCRLTTGPACNQIFFTFTAWIFVFFFFFARGRETAHLKVMVAARCRWNADGLKMVKKMSKIADDRLVVDLCRDVLELLLHYW